MTYTPASALIVVDVQNDFADPSGSLYVGGGEATITLINYHIAAAGASQATIVYTQDWHPPSTPHFEKDGGIWPVHCVAGTVGAQLHPDLHVAEDAVMIKKGVGGEDGYSAFHVRDPIVGVTESTGLAQLLGDVDQIVVMGLALDYCVKETALDASRLMPTSVVADATRAVNLRPGDGARAVAELVSAGVTIL